MDQQDIHQQNEQLRVNMEALDGIMAPQLGPEDKAVPDVERASERAAKKALDLSDAKHIVTRDPVEDDFLTMDQTAMAMRNYQRRMSDFLETMQTVLLEGVSDLHSLQHRFTYHSHP